MLHYIYAVFIIIARGAIYFLQHTKSVPLYLIISNYNFLCLLQKKVRMRECERGKLCDDRIREKERKRL